jgi:hypothetical protein
VRQVLFKRSAVNQRGEAHLFLAQLSLAANNTGALTAVAVVAAAA